MKLSAIIFFAVLIGGSMSASDTTISPDTRYTFPVRMPPGGNIIFKTGRGAESFQVTNRGEFISWDYHAPTGESRKKVYPWDNQNYYPNGRIKPSFSYSELMRNYNSYFLAVAKRDFGREWFPLSFEVHQGKCRFYFDHILLQEWAATEDLTGRKLTVALNRNAEIGKTAIQRIPDHGNLFYPVNLPSSQSRVIDGIPFEYIEQPIRLDKSWFREGNLAGNEMAHLGSFGGRWGGALSGNPTRIQFRIPYRQYEAIYLLGTYEKREDRTLRLTAQFFRTGSGFPKNFGASAAVADENMQVIKIPVNPGELQEFSDREIIELELTGDVHVYRAYPDPSHYSWHGGGLPSGFKVHALTLAVSPLAIDFEPEEFGNVWVEPFKPSYRVKLRNNSKWDQTIQLELATESFDREEKSTENKRLELAAGAEIVTRFDLPLKKFGHHRVRLKAGEKVFERSLAFLRRREYSQRPFNARGFMFGYWNWRGEHLTLSNHDSIKLLGKLGLESVSHNPSTLFGLEVAPEVRKYGMKTFWSNAHGVRTGTPVENIPEYLKNNRLGKDRINEPVYVNVLAEPGGIGTEGSLPEFFGEKEQPMTPEHEEKFRHFKKMLKTAHAEIRRQTPDAKILMPWGDPLFAVPFLKDPETRELFDGIGFDAGYFDRLPEQQLHQCSLHRMFQFSQYWKKYRNSPPVLVSIEGPCLAQVAPGALTETQFAAHMMRASLILGAYGINRQFSLTGSSDCASYWGEQHYGGGFFSRINGVNPHVAYAAAGTMVRHLRHMEFVRWVPVGSHSVYCLQFKDSRNGELLHVMWAVRGTRPVKMKHGQIYDAMDNLLKTPVLTQMPIFVYGNDGTLELGEPDHSDIQLAEHHLKFGNAAELFDRQSQDSDDEYINSFPEAIRRFPTAMDLEKRNDGLAVTLPPQSVDRGTMPYYTTLSPKKPITIPGKAGYITMEVTAASDWGRIVYILRDAKGEKWISVGSRGKWNCDDAPNASYFNFDGKRLVRFELPSHLPWDNFREMGTTWWGASGGDDIVDIPLAIEKIFIERRSQVMYVNTLEKSTPSPVILHNLYAEYNSAAMMKPQPRHAMPLPPVTSNVYNPLKALENSSLAPTEIIAVAPPDYYYDGTRGVFHFKEMPEAAYYDIYLGQTPDGANALKLGSKLKKSGTLVTGFLADTNFYAFIVYYDRKGNYSKPSKPFKFKLQDNFGNK